MQTQQPTKTVSPEAEDLLLRLRDHYRNQGKAAAASNYARHLRSFFSWAEASGHTLQTLPAESVEAYLDSLNQKETSKYVIRTQIKSALREAHNSLGVDFAHLQYESGKPRAVRQAQKAKEKEKRAEKRIEKAASVLQFPFVPVTTQATVAPDAYEHEPVEEFDHMAAETHPTDTPTPPPPQGITAGVSPGGNQPIVVMVPQQNNNQNNQPKKPLATIGGGNGAAPQRGVTINNHTFTGSHIRVSRIADGNDPFVPMGTESYVTTLMASQIAPHGDVAAYMQQFIIPKLRLSQNTSQVPFVFHELNDRKQPTGRRDELVVSVPLGLGSDSGLHGMPSIPAPYGHTPQFDPATQFMFKKLDDDKAAAEKREERLAEELKQTKDSQMQFFLMQQMQREQELKQQLDQQKMQAMQQAMQQNSAPPPVAPVIMPEPPRIDPMVEMQKAREESNSRLLEAIIVKSMTPPPAPPPPPPQKDVTEWLIPLMTQMNQQAMQMQQANQQMMLQAMQSQAQFLQTLATRESPEVKLLRDELKEVRASANSPKADDVEDFADKLQKFKMVGEMLGGGGGGGGGGIIESLLANADTIGEGVAKVLAARNTPAAATQTTIPATVMQAPTPAAPQLQAAPSGPPKPSPELRAMLDSAAEKALKGDDEQGAVTSLLDFIRTMGTSPEPFPNYGERVLNALRTIEDDDDLYAVMKHLWVFMGERPNKPAAKALTAAFFKWFPLIHQQVFGEVRYLAGQTEEEFAELLKANNIELPPAKTQDEADLDEELDSDSEDEDYDDDSDDESDEDGDDAEDEG